MRLHRLGSMILAMALVVLAAGMAQAVNIDVVPVGNPGNTADTQVMGDGTTGYGAVGYTYNIGKYEVTAGQYTEFLNKVGGVDAYALYNTEMSRTDHGSGITRSGGGIVGNPYQYTVDATFANRPVNYVSWGDAARYANWLHNGQPTGMQGLSTTEDGVYYLNGAMTDPALLAVTRKANWKWAITSEDEWHKAAYYKGGSTSAGYWDYPTSSDTAPGRDMADISGNNANYYFDSGAYPIDSGKFTTLVGEFQNSDSPYGTFDQGGNVWEWNEAILNTWSRGRRGGGWGIAPSISLAASFRGQLFPADEWNFVGFRVVSVPEPGSITLVATALLGLLAYAWWRRKRAV